MNQSCLKQRCMKASRVRPERTTWTAASLLHEIWNLEPANLVAQILTATTSTNSSNVLMCKANFSMSLGKANELHSSKHVAPPRCKEESQWKTKLKCIVQIMSFRNTAVERGCMRETKIHHDPALSRTTFVDCL